MNASFYDKRKIYDNTLRFEVSFQILHFSKIHLWFSPHQISYISNLQGVESTFTLKKVKKFYKNVHFYLFRLQCMDKGGHMSTYRDLLAAFLVAMCRLISAKNTCFTTKCVYNTHFIIKHLFLTDIS